MEIFRCLPILILLATALAQYEGYDGGYEEYRHRPIGHYQTQDEHHGDEEYDVDFRAHPKYAFDYSVKDPHTGDNKEHWETRDGDKVKGSYTLLETDGTKRVVEYEADDKNGFNAIVHRVGVPREEVHEEYRVSHKPKPVYEKYENYPHENYQHLDEGFAPVLYGGHEH